MPPIHRLLLTSNLSLYKRRQTAPDGNHSAQFVGRCVITGSFPEKPRKQTPFALKKAPSRRRSHVSCCYFQRKGGRNNKEPKEEQAAGRAEVGAAERRESGGTASSGEDQTGSIRFDTESGRKLSTVKRGVLKKSLASPLYLSTGLVKSYFSNLLCPCIQM